MPPRSLATPGLNPSPVAAGTASDQGDDGTVTSLHHPEVDATNNAAERALRLAVIMRKITGGNRSKPGAKAWSILASVLRTAEQQGREVIEMIKTLLMAEWSGPNIAFLTDID
ncbi:MAG: transposase [Phycisphaeraceae bacterium]|nr:transposase [Phycisphaeraceae bacterium]